MAPCELVMGILFLFQTAVGLLGNFLLLYFYILTLFTKHTQRPTDLILNQLALANFLVLSSRGISEALAAFCLDYFLGEALCKITFYTHRVARGVSLCTTCLLSGIQAITISPNNSKWAELKLKASIFVQTSCCFCWILHLLVNIVVPVKVTHPENTINITHRKFGLCSVEGSDSSIASLYAFISTFLDILCLGSMGWASGSIVLFLQRHKQRVQYLHHTSLPSRAAPETTATHTVLLLVSLFVSFYFLSSVISITVHDLHCQTKPATGKHQYILGCLFSSFQPLSPHQS
ncbi:unnamed protein product [Nyctereutes procyonoides]|uniref:Vomeronasal type-1 receptor n=1 Tax=Nyctereutes procyonoides TaxID=34880 RepID=A0A811ZUG3_NYCPR|nr:unnamed protein product [Nyctereutes procyonoides]